VSYDLRSVVPGGDRPKGFAPYAPRRHVLTVERIIGLYEEMEAGDALPMGPRQCGYRLKERYPGEYAKAGGAGVVSFESLERIIMRLQQEEKLAFEWVADASAAASVIGGYHDPGHYLRSLPDYERDPRQDQPVVVEIYAEARETLPLIERVAGDRGVRVYSRGGSAGPGLAYRVAARAVRRAVAWGQSTHVLGIVDFDLAGIRNVLRPHVEQLSAFTYGTDPRGHDEDGTVLVVAHDGQTMNSVGTATLRFEHLLLTPEDALGIVETDHDRQRIEEYLASGKDLWSRDLELLDGVRKIETEAFDPRELRERVVTAIESVLDLQVLQEVRERGEQEARVISRGLRALAERFDQGARES
jgi:hypothetical protein